MNQDNFKKFSNQYKLALKEVVGKYPEKYAYHEEKRIEEVAGKILETIEKRPLGVNYGGDAFKLTAKKLGIKPTRKAIFEYLGI